MQLKSLRILEAVCDTGHFGQAAERLHTVQSNVTAHVQKLEAELGVQLLERGTPAQPTPAGLVLRDYAQRILQLHDEAVAQLQGTTPPAGRLRIGAIETAAALRLPPVLMALHRAQPGLDIELRTGPTAEMLAALREGQIDAALIGGTPAQPPGPCWPVFQEELVLVSCQPLAQWPQPEALERTPFLAFRQGCSYRQRIELLMARMGVPGARVMEFGTLDAILGCVAAGMGWALLPEAVVQSHQHRFPVHWCRLPDALQAEVAQITTCLVTGSAAGWSPALHAFAQVLGIAAPDRASAPIHALHPEPAE